MMRGAVEALRSGAEMIARVSLGRVALFVILVLNGCRPSSEQRDGGPDGGPDGSGGRENSAGLCANGQDDDDDGLTDCDDDECRTNGFCEVDPDGGPDADEDRECAAVSVGAVTTSAPVDVVWIIDSSGSMRGEAAIVQDNMNSFAAEFSEASIDLRVVVITDPSYVDVPPPLGDDTSRYYFLPRAVRSRELLQQLLDELPRYRSFLRGPALTHFVAVTDDGSDLVAEEFRAAMEAALGEVFTFHAIASEDAWHDCDPLGTNCDPGCEGPNGTSADIGYEYYRLAELTGGRQFSICTADWTSLFDALTEEVIVSATIPCAYAIPAPPAGMVFDPELANAVFTDDAGAETSLARAISPERCGDSLAWFYDSNDAPTRVELCAAACDLVSHSVRGHIDIAFGCAPDEVIY